MVIFGFKVKVRTGDHEKVSNIDRGFMEEFNKEQNSRDREEDPGVHNPWEDLTRDLDEEGPEAPGSPIPEEKREGKETTPEEPAKENALPEKSGTTPSEGSKKKKEKKKGSAYDQGEAILTKRITHPIWLGISECAKLGGVQTKTIRRALKSGKLKYKIVGNRYLIDLKSLVLYLRSTKKLHNKLKKDGIGQYIEKWKK